MKTMKKVMLSGMIVLLLSANAIAFEDSLKVNDTKSFNLVLNNVSSTTQITLKDARNTILFKESVNKGEDFKKTFNMELLPAGNYKVEIEDATRIKELTVDIGNDENVATVSLNKEVFKPVVTERGEKVYVSQFSPEKSPLYISIYNSRNELVHEETLEGKMDLGKKFNFSKAQKGEYRFYLESNGESFDQLVYIEK